MQYRVVAAAAKLRRREVADASAVLKGKNRIDFQLAVLAMKASFHPSLPSDVETLSRYPAVAASPTPILDLKRALGISGNRRDDDDIEEVSVRIGIMDPISLAPIVTPIRGRACKHVKVRITHR